MFLAFVTTQTLGMLQLVFAQLYLVQVMKFVKYGMLNGVRIVKLHYPQTTHKTEHVGWEG